VVDGRVFVSGTTGFDPDTRAFPKDVRSKCENCFRNIVRALEQAGTSFDDPVRVQIFVTSQEEFERSMPIIRKHCYAARPANTTVLANLVAPHMRVEIEQRRGLRATRLPPPEVRGRPSLGLAPGPADLLRMVIGDRETTVLPWQHFDRLWTLYAAERRDS
jgi:enamine deaminase RidA (YjgF/YER057c/UK114 family)